MTALIRADFNGTPVFFQNDAYLNATAIAKTFNKQPRDYLKAQQTKAYLKALAQSLTVKTNRLTKQNQLVTVKRGGETQGTWLHPKLAIHFARWLSAEFAVWCDEQIEKILHKKLNNKTTVTDRVPLKDAVNMLVAKSPLNYSDAYRMVHQAFGVEHIDEIPLERLPEAVRYVHALIIGTGSRANLNRDQKDLITDLIEKVWSLNWWTGMTFLKSVELYNEDRVRYYQDMYCEANQACLDVSRKLELVGLRTKADNFALIANDNHTIQTRKGVKFKMPMPLV